MEMPPEEELIENMKSRLMSIDRIVELSKSDGFIYIPTLADESGLRFGIDKRGDIFKAMKLSLCDKEQEYYTLLIGYLWKQKFSIRIYKAFAVNFHKSTIDNVVYCGHFTQFGSEQILINGPKNEEDDDRIDKNQKRFIEKLTSWLYSKEEQENT